MRAGKIDRIDLYHVDVPLPSPFFPAWIPGYPQNRLRYTLLSVATRDGLVGWATGAAFDRERAGLGDFIGPFLLGLDPYDVHQAADRLRQASFLGWRNGWMELAFWDLAAKARGLPLWALLAETLGELGSAAGPAKEAVPSLPAYASFGELRPARVRAEAIERARDLGFLAAKISVRSRAPEEDEAHLLAARAAAGPDFGLMVHAHQAWNVSLVEAVPPWDLARALRFAEAAAGAGVRWLQEPLHGEAWDALVDLSKRAKLPIAGGDIAPSLEPLRGMIEHGCYSVLTPDVTFVGLLSALRVMRLSAERGLGFSPRTYGDGLALVANLHALAAWALLGRGPIDPWLELPWEPPALIPELRDALLGTPITIDRAGRVPVPDGPGLGVEVDARALRRYAKPFYTLTPVRFVVSQARRSGLKQTAAFARPSKGRRRKVSIL